MDFDKQYKAIESTRHETQKGPLRTIFSIIELEFITSFTGCGPPAFLDDAWNKCLENIKREELWEWTVWAHNTESPSNVYIQIGWERNALWGSGGWKAHVVRSQDAMEALREKDLIGCLEILSPVLLRPPEIYHSQSSASHHPLPAPEGPHEPRRDLDILIIRSSDTGPIYEIINRELLVLKQRCNRVSHWRSCQISSGPGDMDEALFAVDRRNNYSKSNPGTCTFIFIIYWRSHEAMIRFKDPNQFARGPMESKLDRDWWQREVIDRINGIKNEGIPVRFGMYDARIRDQDIYPASLKYSRTIKSPKRRRWSFRLCKAI